MQIVMNGEPLEVAAGVSVAALVEQLGFGRDRLAIEVDGEIVPRSSWPAAVLKDGARVEIVRAIGGG